MKFVNESVEGYKGKRVSYTLYGTSDESKDLLILLPGAGYTVNSPIFHYSSGIFFNQSKDILEVNYSYMDEFYNTFSSEEMNMAVKYDAKAVIDEVLKTNSYEDFFIMGKSLGTIAMSSEMQRDAFKDAKTIWLTPLLNMHEVFTAMVTSENKGLCIIGDKDRHYTEELFNELGKNKNIKSNLYGGANHSLDYSDDPIKSIDLLKTIISDINKFLANHL